MHIGDVKPFLSTGITSRLTVYGASSGKEWEKPELDASFLGTYVVKKACLHTQKMRKAIKLNSKKMRQRLGGI